MLRMIKGQGLYLTANDGPPQSNNYKFQVSKLTLCPSLCSVARLSSLNSPNWVGFGHFFLNVLGQVIQILYGELGTF